MKHYIRSPGHSKEFFTCSMVKRNVITNPSHITIDLLYMRFSLTHKKCGINSMSKSLDNNNKVNLVWEILSLHALEEDNMGKLICPL
jgi:hypothetical protein